MQKSLGNDYSLENHKIDAEVANMGYVLVQWKASFFSNVYYRLSLVASQLSKIMWRSVLNGLRLAGYLKHWVLEA